MPRAATPLTAILLLVAIIPRAGAFDFPKPPPPADVPPVASYRIEAHLLPDQHAAEATEVLTWHSPATVTVDRLLFHLYLNAFSNDDSTFFHEAGPLPEDHPIRPDDWGYVQVRKVELLDEKEAVVADLTPKLTYVHPDDDNEADRTVMAIPLPRPVAPGGTARLRIQFLSRLPRFRARTGYKGNFHFFAQWFPKIGVWEPLGTRGRSPGGWNVHQYHAFTEFYSDYGTYDVRITVPKGWKVGATGEPQGEPASQAGGKEQTFRFLQRAVHDFTWFADPDLRMETRTFQVDALRDSAEEDWLVEKVGVAREDLDLPPIQVTLFYPAEHAHLVDRQFRAVFNAILYFGYWFGPYPYTTLTVLDPPHGGEGAGGMEYPTLITGGAPYWAPSERLDPEGVLVHEFGHQYWYGLVGSNEFEEAWLDEGINTYSTARVLAKAYGPNVVVRRFQEIPISRMPLVEAPGAFPGWTEGDLDKVIAGVLHLRPFGVPSNGLLDALREQPWLTYAPHVLVPQEQSRRHRFLEDPAVDPLTWESWRSYSRQAYVINSYDKPAETLMTLERLVGPDLMIRGMRTYQLTYRYRHPSSNDFVRVFQEATGKDLRWFFDSLVFGVGTVDFAVGRVEQRKVEEPRGVFFRDGELVRKSSPPADKSQRPKQDVWDSRVYIRRNGTAAVPVTIRVERDGEPPIVEEWDGRERWTVLRYRGGKVTRVVVDPNEVWLVDLDLTNNVWADTQDPVVPLRWSDQVLFWMQNLLLFYTSLT